VFDRSINYCTCLSVLFSIFHAPIVWLQGAQQICTLAEVNTWTVTERDIGFDIFEDYHNFTDIVPIDHSKDICMHKHNLLTASGTIVVLAVFIGSKLLLQNLQMTCGLCVTTIPESLHTFPNPGQELCNILTGMADTTPP
jgi:hypothetical protein